jgi:uncharacterized protein YajQ (UPF0234 family)
MPSFDTVLEPNLVEVRNAIDQASKEIGTRFDFKGSSAKVELKDKDITVYGDSDFQLGQVMDVLTAKLTKRSVDARFLDRSAKIEKIGGDKVKQLIKVKAGIDSDTAKKIQQLIKGSKLKSPRPGRSPSARCARRRGRRAPSCPSSSPRRCRPRPQPLPAPSGWCWRAAWGARPCW